MMLRLLLGMFLLLAAACGTPCSRLAAADAAANDKGRPCGADPSTFWDSARTARCESGLSKCSPDDVKWLDTVADCYQKLPVCADGQKLAWTIMRLACLEPLTKLSSTCASTLQ